MRKKVCIGDLGTVVTGKTPSKSNKAFYGDYALFLKPTDILFILYFNQYPQKGQEKIPRKKSGDLIT